MNGKNVPSPSRVCPWWLAPTFDNPLRRWVHNPERILGDLVGTGDWALDLGCGMGYFTIALAQRVGPGGQVIAVDLQEQMLRRARQRAERAGVVERIRFHRNTPQSIGLVEAVDFALAFWMVHEVARPEDFLREVRGLLKPGAHFLLVEPVLHVSQAAFQRTIDIAQSAGLEQSKPWRVGLSRAVVFELN